MGLGMGLLAFLGRQENFWELNLHGGGDAPLKPIADAVGSAFAISEKARHFCWAAEAEE